MEVCQLTDPVRRMQYILRGKPRQAWHMQAHDFNFTKSAMHVISDYLHIKVEQAETKHTWCYTHCTHIHSAGQMGTAVLTDENTAMRVG